jgi:hypothetical protein
MSWLGGRRVAAGAFRTTVARRHSGAAARRRGEGIAEQASEAFDANSVDPA